ncbi:hypothetical protein BBP40_005857 [Aspergillus hancockii]|nr:hypothetical protein BBP40_005857 [Aspergillus hancockii]
MGANSQVLQLQLAAIRNHLGNSHDFVFVNGTIPCDADPEVKSIIPGPYLCYYSAPTPGQVQDAFDLIYEVIEDEGPFDGIIGFSQGAALASSLLLKQAKDSPRDPPLFKMAVLLCASLPFDLDSELAPITTIEVVPQASGFPMKGRDDMLVLQRYRPETTTTRIPIPTLHVIGKADQYQEQGRALAELCADKAEVVAHDAGHIVPKDRLFTAKVVRVFDGMISRELHRM